MTQWLESLLLPKQCSQPVIGNHQDRAERKIRVAVYEKCEKVDLIFSVCVQRCLDTDVTVMGNL